MIDASLKIGFKNILPIMPSVIIFGLILGITGAVGNVSFFLVASTSFIIFAGSSQFIVILLIIQNEPLLGIIVAGILINLRHVMYGAVLHNLVKTNFFKKFLVAYLLTDEAFLISNLTYQTEREKFDSNELQIDNVLIGSGFTLWFFWNLSTDIGYFFAEFVKEYVNFSPEFIVAATFVGYFVMNWTNSPNLKEKYFIVSMCGLALFLSFFFQSSTLIIGILLSGIFLSSSQKFLSLRRVDEQIEVV
jgi:predicted branched-subunit amino acid permease